MAAFLDRFAVPLWIAAGVLAIFLYVVARHFLSGWPLLARRFRTGRPQPAYAGTASMTFRYLIHYKLDIRCASDAGGVYLAFSPALGRARLYIPWDEIEFLPRFNWIFVRYQPLLLGRKERVRCVMFRRQADVLLRDANRQPLEKLSDLGFGLDPRLPVYTTPPAPPPTITDPKAEPRA